MTDNEIVKALECCIKPTSDCDNCPAYNVVDDENCFDIVKQGALDLINRQKAEIEQLQTLVNEMSDYFPACIGCEGKTELGERTDKCVYLIDTTNYCTKRGIANIFSIKNENRELKAEIERLKDKIKKAKDKVIETIPLVEEDIKTAKSEAYREFAERIKIRFAGTLQCSSWVIQKAVDNILKELVGEDDE